MTDPTPKTAKIPILNGKRILLGVTGSVAAYKAVDLASRLTQAGSAVDVLMTRAAESFVSPLTFRSVTGRGAYTESDLWGAEAHVLHVDLARKADAYVIAPATANTIFKLAYGVSNSLVSLAALAAECPIMVAPAMDVGMYQHTAVRANVEILHARGVTLAGPTEGRMASGLVGKGRLLEPAELVGHLRLMLGRAWHAGAREGHCDRRGHTGGDRPGARDRQPVVRQARLRPGPGGARPGCRGHLDRRADGASDAGGCQAPGCDQRCRNEGGGDRGCRQGQRAPDGGRRGGF